MAETLLSTLRFFLIILAELIPLFFVVTFISGLALEYISPEKLRSSLAGRKGPVGRLVALALGYVTPFCSCSTIPVLAGMVKAGIPIGVMTSFLTSSPYPVEIAIPILAPLFGVPSAVMFLVSGGVLAFLSGGVAQRLGWDNQVRIAVETPANGTAGPELDLMDLGIDESFRARAGRAWAYTLGFARKLLLLIVVSSFVGSLIYGFIPESFILQYAGGSSPWTVVVATLIGIPLYVNAAAVVPIIYSLSLKGVSQGAVIAFLITATTISPPEIMMLAALFKNKYVLAFAAVMVIGAIVTGYAINWVAN